VAKLTLANLLNDGRPLQARWGELSDDDTRPGSRIYSFRLFRLVDAGDSTQVSATDEAIMLYLQALDVDLTDREAATKLILRRQMEAGEFERARHSAVEARRTAEALAASLRDRLDQTRRDLRGVDWTKDVPAELRRAHQHVTEQLDLDRHIIDLADHGLSRGSASEQNACRSVVVEVRRSQEVHTRLERLIVGAIPVYLDAQQAQRFTTGPASLAIDLGPDLLVPYLSADPDTAQTVAEHLAAWVALRRPMPWSPASLIALLLRPPTMFEPSTRAWEDPGELDAPEPTGLPEDVESAAAAVFRACHSVPHRLSELAILGAHHHDTVNDPLLLDDVIHLAGAGRFITGADRADEPDSATGLTAVLENLVAVPDGVHLVGDRWTGDDVLVGRPEDLPEHAFPLPPAAAALKGESA
jgi:hypothetical protein